MLNDSGRDSPDLDDEEEPDGPDDEEEEEDVDVELDGLDDGAANLVPPDDLSMHESLTMEQFNSPLVESQYRSTYAIVANTGEIRVLFQFYFSSQNQRLFGQAFIEHTWSYKIGRHR